MSNSFEILAGFLDRFGEEVEGRGLQEPPENIQMQLRAFARGDLAASQHEALLSLLNQNLGWIAWLATEVKAMRTERGAKE